MAIGAIFAVLRVVAGAGRALGASGRAGRAGRFGDGFGGSSGGGSSGAVGRASIDFEIKGAESFAAAARYLRNFDKELNKEVNRQLRAASKPLIEKARREAERTLPSTGGLNKRVAKAPARVQIRTGRDPGVRIVVSRGPTAARCRPTRASSGIRSSAVTSGSTSACHPAGSPTR